jgi:hypothetical protein
LSFNVIHTSVLYENIEIFDKVVILVCMVACKEIVLTSLYSAILIYALATSKRLYILSRSSQYLDMCLKHVYVVDDISPLSPRLFNNQLNSSDSQQEVIQDCLDKAGI